MKLQRLINREYEWHYLINITVILSKYSVNFKNIKIQYFINNVFVTFIHKLSSMIIHSWPELEIQRRGKRRQASHGDQPKAFDRVDHQ